MPDPATQIVIGIGTVGSVVTGIFSYLFKSQVATNKEHVDRITELEKEQVTKEDLTQVEGKMETRLDRLDTTIIDGFKEISRNHAAIHRRVDDIYRDIPKRPNS